MKYLLLIFVFALGFYIGRYTAWTSKDVAPIEIGPSKEAVELKSHSEPKTAAVATQETKANTPAPQTLNPEPVVESEAPRPETRVSKKSWTQAEKTIPQIHNSSQVAAFLEKVRIKDFARELTGATTLPKGDEMIDLLNGAYAGSMQPQDGSTGFNIFLNASIQSQNQALNGRVSIRLSRDGKTFSRSSSNGEIRNIQRLGQTSMAVIITAGDYSFQLYYIPSLESFEGNCYQQYQPGQMQFVGTVHLERA